MIWGWPYFRKPPFMEYAITSSCLTCSNSRLLVKLHRHIEWKTNNFRFGTWSTFIVIHGGFSTSMLVYPEVNSANPHFFIANPHFSATFFHVLGKSTFFVGKSTFFQGKSTLFNNLYHVSAHFFFSPKSNSCTLATLSSPPQPSACQGCLAGTMGKSPREMMGSPLSYV